jgi:hypothetical protein
MEEVEDIEESEDEESVERDLCRLQIVSSLCRVCVSSSDVVDTVSSVVVTAGSEDLSTTGENDGHASRLEEVLA